MWTYYLWAHPPGSVSGHIFRHHSDAVETWVRDLGDSAQGYWTSGGMWTEDRGCCPTKTKQKKQSVDDQAAITQEHLSYLSKLLRNIITNTVMYDFQDDLQPIWDIKNNRQHKTSRGTIVSGDSYHATHEQCPVQRKGPCLETQRHGAAQSIVGKEIPSASLRDQSWSLDDNMDQHSTSAGTESRSRIVFKSSVHLSFTHSTHWRCTLLTTIPRVHHSLHGISRRLLSKKVRTLPSLEHVLALVNVWKVSA